MSEVKKKDVIFKGEWPEKVLKLVVCRVYDEQNIEVVYLDYRNRAINEDMVLKDGKWEFKISGPCGGYADNYPRLSEYVKILRNG
jgi:hypothetical protein